MGLEGYIEFGLPKAVLPSTHGIRRNRFYFRNYQDCVKVSRTVVLEPNDIEGPLLDFSGHAIPFGPLLRVRSVLGHNVYQLSWTAYQPISLIWNYLFWREQQHLITRNRDETWLLVFLAKDVPGLPAPLSTPLFLICSLFSSFVL